MKDTKQVIFSIGEEEYGLDIMAVNGIETYTQVVKLPNAPECIVGLIRLREDVIPVYSLRQKFGLPQMKATDDTRLIITRSMEGLLAYEVDQVKGIMEIPMSEVKEPPVIVKNEQTAYMKAVANQNGRMIILLNHDGIVSHAEKDTIQSIQREHNE